MAKVNKSAVIREAFDRLGHDAKPAAVVAELKGKVSVGLVNAVKQSLRKGKRKSHASSGIDLSALLAAKALAEKVGGIDKARTALEALAKLS